jgi:hypothetical protein
MPPRSTGAGMGLPAEALDTIDAAIAAFVPPSDEWIALKDASRRFLKTPWHVAVIQHGWSELEIFGAFPHASLDVVCRRTDALGLAPAIWLGRGCSIESIHRDHAMVSRRATGARLRHRRALTGPSVVWWFAPYAEAL